MFVCLFRFVLCCVALFFQPARGSGGESGESRAGSRGSGSACGMRNRERKKKEAGGSAASGASRDCARECGGGSRGSAGAGSGEWRVAGVEGLVLRAGRGIVREKKGGKEEGFREIPPPRGTPGGTKKRMQHRDFPGGHPSQYYSGPKALNFRVLMGSGVVALV